MNFLSWFSFSETILFLYHFGHWLENFWLLEEIAGKRCQNWNQHVYWKPVKRCFGRHIISSSSILDIHRKTFDFCQKVLGSVVELHSTCPYEHSEQKDLFFNKLIISNQHWLLSAKFRLFVEKNLAALWELHFTCLQEACEE